MSGGEALLLLIAAFVAAGLACVLVPPEPLLRLLGRPPAPTGEERREAEQRAKALLGNLIGGEEFERLVKRGYLDVPSGMVPERIYRIPYFQGMISVIEGGIATMQLCLVPTRWVPDADVVIIHKLLIEGDEARYLRLANRFPTGTSRLIMPSWWDAARSHSVPDTAPLATNEPERPLVAMVTTPPARTFSAD